MQRRVLTILLDANTVYKQGLKRVLENTRYHILKTSVPMRQLTCQATGSAPAGPAQLILLGMVSDNADPAAAVCSCRNTIRRAGLSSSAVAASHIV